VYLKVYIFNVSNANAFLTGTDKKLKLAEIGPYVYQEFLINENPTFHENGTLTFIPKRNLVFVREMSIGDPEKDVITVPNAVLLAGSSVAAKHSTFSALAMTTLVKSLNARSFLNLTVYDYMWGYDDNLVRLANNILPNFITFDKLGFLDRVSNATS
jgi:scavenger receptor class B, member 1